MCEYRLDRIYNMAHLAQGAGNSVFTLMRHNENPELNVFATDYSAEAVKVVQVGF
jgi:hypothetical protein